VIEDKTVKDTKDSKDENNEETKAEEAKNPVIVVSSTIPGLTEKERKKALKAAQKKQQKSTGKEQKKNKKETRSGKDFVEPNKARMKASDFLLNKNDPSSITDKYQFSDYSSESENEEDIFENSKETQSDTEFLTPINYTSIFGRRLGALSTSSPDLSRKKKPKRAASSPSDSSIIAKKPRSKSLIPTKK
jgi:hypothetical protein